jgi:ABC-type transport system involved in multi-copper enzyme maturation permease subunit
LGAWGVRRKPEPLSFLAEGCETRLGHFVRVNHKHVPYTAAWGFVLENPEFARIEGIPIDVDIFVKDLQSFDLALILQIVLSLFAILLVHDSISGEKEGGTLKLLASQGISRGSILMGKYIGAMAALVIPFTIAILLGMIYIPLEIGKEIGSDEILRILLLYISSILYLSVFTTIGILISSATRRSSTSLIFGLFVWVFLVVIWPNIIGFVAESMYNKIPYDEDSIRKKIDHLIGKDYSRDVEAIKARYPFLKDIPFGFDYMIRKIHLLSSGIPFPRTGSTSYTSSNRSPER